MALLALFSSLVPGEAHAQATACSLAPLTATDQTGPAGTPLNFGFQVQGGCAPLVNVVATITPPDNTGGATVAPAGNFDVAPATPTDITVTLGPNPGQSGTVTLSCPTGGCNNTIVYTFRTSNEFIYDNVTTQNLVTNQIRNFSISTILTLNGNPGTLASDFTNLTDATAYGPRPANGVGVSTLTENIPADGNYVIRANIDCPVAFVLEGCAAVPFLNFNVLVEAVSLDPVTPLAVTATAGSPETLTVSYGSASFAGPAGTPISWVVASQPAGGDGSVTGSNLLAGESDAVFDATVPGTYTVQASVACAVCAVNTRTFAVTVVPAPLPFTLVATSANPATGTVGVAQTFSVQLDQGGLPVPAETIQWTAAGAPFGPASSTSLTDAGGSASVTLTPTTAGAFTGALTATYDPDGVPASGDEVSVDFAADIASVPGLDIDSGDSQQADTGQPFAQPLIVVADDSGVPAVGVGITWTVTGDAVVTPSGVTDAAGQASATVVAGATPGPVTVTATRQDAPAVSVTFNLTTNAAPYTLVATSANPAGGTVGVAQTFSVQLQQGGLPVAGAAIEWSAPAAPFGPASASSSTDAAGNASATFTPSAAGTFPAALSALYDPDGVPASGDEISVAFDANIAAVPGLTIGSGDGQQATVGQAFALPLVVQADDSGVPAAGIGITWTVTGDAVLSPGGATDATGHASATVVAGTTPGPVTVTATRQDAPAASVTFNLTANAAPYALVATSANPAGGTVGVAQTFSVQLEQGGLPVAGAAIAWTAGTPFAPGSAAGTTDASGGSSASFTPSAAGSFAAAVTALFDPDGIAASGDELSVVFGANVAAVPGLAIDSGDGQAAAPGAVLDLPLVVLADDSGVPAAGVVVIWTVTGDASVVAGGPTDASGRTSASVTAGSTPGPFVVTATRQDAPAASVTFSLSVDAPGTLQVVSGENQVLQAGVPTEPLVVRLLDAGGTPVAGASIAWTSSNGSLDAASTTTDANGETSNLLTPAASGSSDVVASSPLAIEPAVFALKGSLSDLPGLSATAQEVAQAVDSLCPALAALPSRSAGEQDLLDRCRELQDAAAIDPVATVLALDQLMADVALAQSNAAFAAAQSQFQNLRARIAALRSGTQGTDFGGLALTTPQGLFSLGLMMQSLGDEDPAPMEVGSDFSRWGFFASGTLGRGEVDPGRIDPAYDTDIEGLSAGVDYRLSDRLILGGALGMTRQDTTLPGGRGEVETSGWSVSGYTTFYQPDSWYMDGVLTWGRNDYDLQRSIRYTLPLPGGGTREIDQRAVSSSEGDLLAMAFTFGRDFNRGAWGLGPYGRLLYTRLDFEVIEESLQAGPGSGLGLRIEQRDLESLASVLGGKLTYTHSTDWGVLMPHLQLEWEHEFRDDPQALEARFLNDPTGSAILLRGDELDTDYFRIGLGLSMVLTKGRSGFFYYEQLMGKDRSSQYNLALGFRMEF